MRHAPDEETAHRILDNRLYESLTERFVQSHDYVAMERLFEIHQTGKYDLIIVDTPPTRNALDFLDAPARMADFFGGRLLRWLTAPYRVGGKRGARIITMASKPFYTMADRILGSQFLQDIAEFFLNFQSMYDGFVAALTRGRSAPARQAHHVRGGDHARGRAAARGRAVLRRAREARLPPRRARAEQDAAGRDLRARRRAWPRRGCGPRRRRSPRGSPGSRATTSTPRPACSRRSAPRSRTSPSSRVARTSSGTSCGRDPTSWSTCPTFADEISDLGGLARIAAHLAPG